MNASGLSSDQIKLQARVRELAAGPVARRAAEVDRTEQYPWDNVELLKDAKLLGMTIPQQYGGQGRNWLDAVLVIEALSSACSVTGRIAVETNMGAISAVMAYGSDEQKKLAADMVLSGDKPAICITEPEAGIGRQRHDHARRQEGQPLRRQRPQALDHRRRRLAPAPDLRQGLRREGQRGRHRRLSRHPRRDSRA